MARLVVVSDAAHHAHRDDFERREPPRLALRRRAEYAQNVCSDELEVCDEPTSLSELFAHDPTAKGDHAAKEDL